MPATPSTDRSRRNRKLPWGWILAAGVVVLAGTGWWWSHHKGTDTSAYRTAPVDRGDIRVAISATGTLSATSTVTVGSQISGQVTDVLVDFNSPVRKGQILARIDPATYEAQIEQGSAQIASARASLQQAQATLRNATLVYQRNASLAPQQLIARSDLDASRAAMQAAQAQVNVAQAQIRQQTASTQTTRLNLGRAIIRSPVDGVVLTRKIEPGQTVAASLQAPELFTIAEDLSKMRIQLAVDESDIGQVKVGQAVTFTADAFPDRQFKGEVEQVQMSATTTNNVVTYPVLVAVDNADGTLLPGLTVNAEIEVSRQANVLRVANAALRWKPADDASVAQDTGGRGGMGGMSDDLPRIAAGLKLAPNQQAAFDAVVADMKARAAARQQGGGQGQAQSQGQRQGQQGGASRLFGGGGPGFGGGRGNGGGSDPAMQAQMRARMRDRFQQQFAGFRAMLDDSQRAQWDAAVAALLNARRAPLYLLVNGKVQRVMVRLGASDGSNTQVSGGVKEGDLAITGQQASGTGAGAKK